MREHDEHIHNQAYLRKCSHRQDDAELSRPHADRRETNDPTARDQTYTARIPIVCQSIFPNFSNSISRHQQVGILSMQSVKVTATSLLTRASVWHLHELVLSCPWPWQLLSATHSSTRFDYEQSHPTATQTLVHTAPAPRPDLQTHISALQPSPYQPQHLLMHTYRSLGLLRRLHEIMHPRSSRHNLSSSLPRCAAFSGVLQSFLPSLTPKDKLDDLTSYSVRLSFPRPPALPFCSFQEQVLPHQSKSRCLWGRHRVPSRLTQYDGHSF